MTCQLSLAARRLRRRPKWQSEGDYGAPVQMDGDLIARRLRLPDLAFRPATLLLAPSTPKRKVASSAGAGSGTVDERMDRR